jgi:hypothetical protein
MRITPFLRGQSFDPSLVDAMSLAFANACASLDLAVQADPMTELVAHHIIELAQSGVRTPTALYARAVIEFVQPIPG